MMNGNYICPYAKQLNRGDPYANCALKEEDGNKLSKICPFTRWCANERKMKMTEFFLKGGCNLYHKEQKKNKTQEVLDV